MTANKPCVLEVFSLPEPDPSCRLVWFAMRTKSLCEHKVVIGLRERGFDAYLPAEADWKRNKTGSRERRERPLIPGYVFVGVGPGKSLYFAMQVESATGVVGWDGQAREIDPRFVYGLRARQAAGEFDHTASKRDAFRPGMKAKVLLKGPFQDLIGRILKSGKDGRVELMMCEALNWKASMHVDELKLVEDEKKAA
ncbi:MULTISPECIES: transcription termination/antitermination protein NusG [unclassified Brevundimonas]|uniref:transcription termination/antitermination protein NusG n=1 Tax=unclassified Brevundimonas TaxID=2622653 RepID=UPI0014308111|nr:MULTISPECIES: transcription termination/antitermination NusG family protein [unclassified Brevundimonas]